MELLLLFLFYYYYWRHVIATDGQWGCILSGSLLFRGRNVNPEGLVRTHGAVNPSVALQGVSASVRKVGTRLRTRSLHPTGSMCVTSAGYLTRISDILIALPWRVTDRWKQWRSIDAKAFFLPQIICPGAQRGHGSALWCDSFTIWRYLCCFPVGICCQLHQDDAFSGHLEVSLTELILKIAWPYVNERQLWRF